MAADQAHNAGAGTESAEVISLRIGKWLRTQSVVAIVLALALLPLGRVAAYSSLLGSLAAFVPALFFAAYAGRKIGPDSAAFFRAAVVGEAVKLLLIAVICMAVFLWVKPLAAGLFFVGMVVVIIAGWVGLILGLKTIG